MAQQLIVRLRLLFVAAVAGSMVACSSQAGPNDKTVSGKDYNEVVNSTVPEGERNMGNSVRDSVLAPDAKK